MGANSIFEEGEIDREQVISAVANTGNYSSRWHRRLVALEDLEEQGVIAIPISERNIVSEAVRLAE